MIVKCSAGRPSIQVNPHEPPYADDSDHTAQRTNEKCRHQSQAEAIANRGRRRPAASIDGLGALNGLANTHVGGKRNVVDATFQRDEEQNHMDEADALGTMAWDKVPPEKAMLTGMIVSTPKLRWSQFSLRTLLIVVTLCAIPCSWLAVKMRRAEREKATAADAAKRRQAVAAAKKLGGYDPRTGLLILEGFTCNFR